VKPDAVGRAPHAIQEYVVRQRDGLWEVRLDDHLLSGQPTKIDAFHVAEALANAAALRGKQSRILVGDLDGRAIEFPVIGPTTRQA